MKNRMCKRALRQGSKIYIFCVLNRVRVSLSRPNPPTQIPVEHTPGGALKPLNTQAGASGYSSFEPLTRLRMRMRTTEDLGTRLGWHAHCVQFDDAGNPPFVVEVYRSFTCVSALLVNQAPAFHRVHPERLHGWRATSLHSQVSAERAGPKGLTLQYTVAFQILSATKTVTMCGTSTYFGLWRIVLHLILLSSISAWYVCGIFPFQSHMLRHNWRGVHDEVRAHVLVGFLTEVNHFCSSPTLSRIHLLFVVDLLWVFHEKRRGNSTFALACKHMMILAPQISARLASRNVWEMRQHRASAMPDVGRWVGARADCMRIQYLHPLFNTDLVPYSVGMP